MQRATYHATSAVWAGGPGRQRAPVPVTAAETSGPQDDAGHGRASPPGPPASVVVQMQHVFHELHANGRNALCAVCDGQYGGPGTAS
jgi:hypothetical protein